MAGLRIRLPRVGRLPAPVRAALRVGDVLAFPGDQLDDRAERLAHPVTSRRLARCTLATRGHVVGLADLPAKVLPPDDRVWSPLLRLRVERPEGEVEACVAQAIPGGLRRLAPGSSLRVLAHEDDPAIAVVDWAATGRALGRELVISPRLDQFGWPARADWPAEGAIEIRDHGKRERRLAEQRAAWEPLEARVRSGRRHDAFQDGRARWTFALDAGTVDTRVPALALERLVAYRATKLVGVVDRIDRVVNTDATLAVLRSPDGELAVDWQACFSLASWQPAPT